MSKVIPMHECARAELTVDVGRICRNYNRIRARVAPCKVMAVLKANAYGLGLRSVAVSLLEVGVDRFGVACLDEALAIGDLGIPVQILGAVLAEEIELCVAHNIVMPLSDERMLAEIVMQCQRQKKRANVHVLVDSGMGRLGIGLQQAGALLQAVHQSEEVTLEGVYSHFPSAYDDIAFSMSQIDSLLNVLRCSGVYPPLLHIANSDAINNIPSAFAPPFNMVRVGINLYGYFDAVGERVLALDPVITLRAKLVAVRSLPAGASIGYGRTYRLPVPQRIGTLALGYADGLPLQMSQGGEVMVRGKRCPIVGRISMDYTTILLDAVPETQAGEWATCLGEGLSLETWAIKKQTIPYDVICALGQRVRRLYSRSDSDQATN